MHVRAWRETEVLLATVLADEHRMVRRATLDVRQYAVSRDIVERRSTRKHADAFENTDRRSTQLERAQVERGCDQRPIALGDEQVPGRYVARTRALDVEPLHDAVGDSDDPHIQIPSWSQRLATVIEPDGGSARPGEWPAVPFAGDRIDRAP